MKKGGEKNEMLMLFKRNNCSKDLKKKKIRIKRGGVRGEAIKEFYNEGRYIANSNT